MRANDWCAKFIADRETAVKEFAEEMQKLVADRTAKSSKEFYGESLSGAIRETQQKWAAVCRRSQVVSESDFFTLMSMHAPETILAYQKFQSAKQVKQEREAQASKEKSRAGRTFGKDSSAASSSLLKGTKSPNKKDRAAGLKMKEE